MLLSALPSDTLGSDALGSRCIEIRLPKLITTSSFFRNRALVAQIWATLFLYTLDLTSLNLTRLKVEVKIVKSTLPALCLLFVFIVLYVYFRV